MPDHLTKAQLDWFAQQTDNAVRKALRHYIARALIAYAILAGGVGVAIYTSATDDNESDKAIVKSGRIVAVDSCNRDFKAQQRFINLLERLQVASEQATKRSGVDPERARQALAFYASEIGRAKAGLPDCREAKNVITDNSKEQGGVPTPLHPGVEG
jgi:hypothetical protein